MYAWLWGHLPGPVPVRLIISVMLFAAIIVLLFLVVFPWVEHRLPVDDTGVDEQPATTHSTG